MPHNAVFRKEESTTKTRVVFNSSAAPFGNDVLDQGPSLLPKLRGWSFTLLRMKKVGTWRYFRQTLKKQFCTLSVNEEDRRYLRFMWPDEQGIMMTYRLARLPFGVNCSPFILTAVLRQHLNVEASKCQGQDKISSLTLELMRDSFYDDDCISSVDTDLDAGQPTPCFFFSVRVLQGAPEDVTMRRSLEKKWIAQLKENDRFQVNRDEGADILSLQAKTFCTHLTLTNDTPAFPPIFFPLNCCTCTCSISSC